MSHAKRHKLEQSRSGNPATRLREFEVIRHQVKHRKDAFTKRLQRLIRKSRGKSGCLLHTGTLDHNGYPRMNFRDPKHGHVTIHAIRVIAILRNCAPIPAGKEAAHMDNCRNRRCVLHIALLPYHINARTAGPDAGIPF